MSKAVCGLVAVAAAGLALAGCVAPPVVAIPGQGKSYSQFQADDTACRGGTSAAPVTQAPAVATSAQAQAGYLQCMAQRGNTVASVPRVYPYPPYTYGYAYPSLYPYSYPYWGPYGDGAPWWGAPWWGPGLGVAFAFGPGPFGGPGFGPGPGGFRGGPGGFGRGPGGFGGGPAGFGRGPGGFGGGPGGFGGGPGGRGR